ncbi:uncharacterized protein Pyn_37724 [Prunus yedoensis var. nudiflora]|uniref:Uncharacterized protein n=1 Tax=Prunus yedoensis var. nudiflora TaxID=2094558 RepID=A0A314ZGK4_PRUYE|nr:uncharacterized protein Pyn_37724 [Prunus yedoensis var. nudiflora]
MSRTCRLILYISVDSLDGVTQVEPEGGWENPFLCYHIQVDCKNCRMEDAQYHKALACPKCMGCGGLRILKKGGEPITDEGQDMPVMEIEVIGSFHVHEKLKLFYFKWICRKDDGSGEFLGPFSVDKDGSYAFSDSGIKGCFQVTPREEEVEGLWIKVASKSSQACDSDSDSEDSDADSDD